MLLPNPGSVLLRRNAGRWRTLYSGSYFEGIRRRLAARRERKDFSPAARLGTLVMSNVDDGRSSQPDPDDPAVLLRIEAYLHESGDRELQQLVKEYLAEV